MTGSKATAYLTPRRVHKVGELYFVIQGSLDEKGKTQWEIVSKGYAHSTSAFAKLGRLYQDELLGK